jgi:hypothetical protein
MAFIIDAINNYFAISALRTRFTDENMAEYVHSGQLDRVEELLRAGYTLEEKALTFTFENIKRKPPSRSVRFYPPTIKYDIVKLVDLIVKYRVVNIPMSFSEQLIKRYVFRFYRENIDPEKVRYIYRNTVRDIDSDIDRDIDSIDTAKKIMNEVHFIALHFTPLFDLENSSLEIDGECVFEPDELEFYSYVITFYRVRILMSFISNPTKSWMHLPVPPLRYAGIINRSHRFRHFMEKMESHEQFDDFNVCLDLLTVFHKEKLRSNSSACCESSLSSRRAGFRTASYKYYPCSLKSIIKTLFLLRSVNGNLMCIMPIELVIVIVELLF